MVVDGTNMKMVMVGWDDGLMVMFWIILKMVMVGVLVVVGDFGDTLDNHIYREVLIDNHYVSKN